MTSLSDNIDPLSQKQCEDYRSELKLKAMVHPNIFVSFLFSLIRLDATFLIYFTLTNPAHEFVSC